MLGGDSMTLQLTCPKDWDIDTGTYEFIYRELPFISDNRTDLIAKG